MVDIVIAGYARSPFHFANKGALAKVRPDDLVAQVIKGLVHKTGIEGKAIEAVFMGCAFPEGEQGLNVARLAVFLADLPQSVGGATVNHFCGSSMQAIHMAAGAISMGAGDAYVCAGIESMTRVPMMGFNPLLNPALAKEYPPAYVSMGETAENVADKYTISRKDQDQFSLNSHLKAAEAQGKGNFRDEIIPIKTDAGDMVDQDGCIRGNSTIEGLAGLSPAFKEEGNVTAGSSSPLTDGATAVIVCTADFAKAQELDVLAKIRSIAVAGCAPEIMGIGPVAATNKAIARAGITLSDLDVIELNEAFASQALACMADLNLDESKINLDGGAIAIGHPLGATGARITGKAAQLLKREKGKFALATQCIGGGQGIATVLEAVG
ncbi:acetyl-CoA acetyltransferase [Kiloniella spongiae]|uniref:Acetyl-CoA acetyltransferase n=1 Tax=Kiloniella spongiae TaxID=1489064 RepID=A0A0H2MD29_9PROT|nr:thiolase family protein [Kiloniella spongiae]KLN60424.1 acetyl-CoA acetyltransferase [Kiloniella spongiae]